MLKIPFPPGVTITRFEAPRTYESILADARCVAFDDAPAIARLCEEAGTLSVVEKETVLRQLHHVTGLSIKTLRQQADASEDRNEPDQLTLARSVIDTVGRENIIQAGSQTWKFAPTGVWKQCDDREVKQAVQTTLERERLTVTASRVNGIMDVLKTEIFKPHHEFNLGNPETVNCLNGELELLGEHWHLSMHQREMYRTTQIPVAYDPSAHAPMFWHFLNDIFRDDADKNEKITVVLEMMGYALMSHAKRERFMLLIGSGSNGKSVLLSTIEALLGKENVAGVQPAQFDGFQRAHLDQKLANIITELKQGETIADAQLKSIVSGEKMTVERKNEHPFDMRPFATCFFGTNHMPHTRDYSDAFFRRAIVLTFNRHYDTQSRDTNLSAKLATELPGILNYALWAYAQVVVRNGFTIPASSIEAQRRWQTEANQVAQFVEDRCTVRPDARVTIAGLYETYRGWAMAVGIKQTLGQRHFTERLEQMGYQRVRGTGGTWMIAGLSGSGLYGGGE